MTRTETRELTFELLYSLEIQKNEKSEYSEQIEMFLNEQEINQEKAKTYINQTILGINENEEEILKINISKFERKMGYFKNFKS